MKCHRTLRYFVFTSFLLVRCSSPTQSDGVRSQLGGSLPDMGTPLATQVYQQTYGRNPTQQELSQANGQLSSGAMTPRNLADYLQSLPEYQTVGGQIGQDVRGLYFANTGRYPSSEVLFQIQQRLAAGESFQGIALDIQSGKIPGADPSDPNIGWIIRLYLQTLGRFPSYSETYQNWIPLVNGQTTFTEVSTNLDGLDQTGQIINSMYLTLLGRPADPQGLANWESYVQQGHTLADVNQMILGSQEYQNIHGTTSTAGLSGDPIAAKVTQAYRDVLLREPDPEGLSNFTTAIKQGMDPLTFFRMLVWSPEATSRRIRVSNIGGIVRMYYHYLFGREPDPEGYDHWVAFLSDYSHTIEGMYRQFVSSPEGQAKGL